MDYRTVGRTGVRVSNLCFGTMSFGDTADEAESTRMFGRCLDSGINFFDCANVYAGGRSEEILGELMTELRDELVITSKVFGPVGPDINSRGLSRRHIVQAVENTLKRLKTDRLDFYFVHQYDYETPMEETIKALDELVRRGLILYPAVSNWAAWQITKALGISQLNHSARFELAQPMYNLTKRQAEVEILPMAASEQMGIIPYSPLGGGLLSGKYGSGSRPETGRLVENSMYMKRYGRNDYYDIAERFTAYASERSIHPTTLAVAWVGSHPAVTAPIIGARNVEQLEPSLAASNFKMTAEMRNEITALTPEIAPAHDRREEQLPKGK
ncbi:MAG: aldo/keto reductase [Deinococcales bacterium]|nr:aldo/keto reductase [Deinococcales bacterium]